MITVSEFLIKELGRIAIPFEETSPEHVIARLIREHTAQNPRAKAETGQIASEGVVASGVVIPNGSRVRGVYRGRPAEGEIRDSRFWVGGQSYSAPSAAAVAAAEMLGAKGGAINGWYWWEIEVPPGSGKWQTLDKAFRSDANRRKNSA